MSELNRILVVVVVVVVATPARTEWCSCTPDAQHGHSELVITICRQPNSAPSLIDTFWAVVMCWQ